MPSPPRSFSEASNIEAKSSSPPSSPMLGLRFCCIELGSPIGTSLQTPGLWDVRPPESETDRGRNPHVGYDTGAPLLGELANLSQREARATYGQGGRNVKRARPAPSPHPRSPSR